MFCTKGANPSPTSGFKCHVGCGSILNDPSPEAPSYGKSQCRAASASIPLPVAMGHARGAEGTT
eukprot:103085-Pyramimonas_sp.AAC.1